MRPEDLVLMGPSECYLRLLRFVMREEMEQEEEMRRLNRGEAESR